MQRLSALKQYFGHTQFRKGQEACIESLLAGRDALGVMPTGAGKSICYQLPAMLLPGCTLVISPLISLMHDQVSALSQAGIAAAYINSSLTPAEYSQVLKNAMDGAYKIIYVAPERLTVDSFLQFANNADISLLTVDEAHCVSQWGQDFRPGYLEIRPFIDSLKKRPVVGAFTATATPEVRADIIKLLGLNDPQAVATGFDRENLYFEVLEPENKFKALQKVISRNEGKSGIVYCATRKAVEQVCEKLNDEGISATRYHAGLEDAERQRNQNDFIFDRRQIMVATNAFGMGIDKSNVGFVVHYNMPKNLESYYQEAGRAGRDGERAECVLLYSGQDVRINRFLIENNSSDNIANDMALLKVMTYYSTTTDCLRSYILKYFGESISFEAAHCSNCSNCLTQFDEIDITIDAQKVVSCVYRINQRGYSFGKSMLIDVLRGGTSAKLLRMGFDSLSTYGIMAESTVKRLHSIIDFLCGKGYLALSSGDYPVISLTGQSNAVLKDRIALKMKMAKEKVRRKERKTADESGLFTALKALRSSFAKGAAVPAYIIFSDASLRDMCDKQPTTIDEFLDVSGVGQTKADKYGAQFTALIAECKVTAAAAPVKTAPNQGKSWLASEDKQLQQEFAAGQSIKTISDTHGRTHGAINSRLKKLGLIED